jgi:hypothetical protein
MMVIDVGFLSARYVCDDRNPAQDRLAALEFGSRTGQTYPYTLSSHIFIKRAVMMK